MPAVPGAEFIARDQDGRLTKEAERVQSIFISGLVFAWEDCSDQIKELATVLKVQGATITDVPVKAPSPKQGFFTRVFR